jgi:hypothetical protein
MAGHSRIISDAPPDHLVFPRLQTVTGVSLQDRGKE